MADISADEQALALATKRGIQAAGGLPLCERETGISDSQLSRCSSPNHRDSITVRDAVTIDSLGHGSPGHPHIVGAMARQIGAIVIMLPDARADATGLQMSVLELSRELGDVAAAVHDAVSSSGEDGAAVTKAERERIIEQLLELDRASARLRHQLEGGATGTG